MLSRSSRPEVFCKKVFLEISQNFTKISATILKKSLWHSCFPLNFVEFLRAPFLIEHLWWLLLAFVSFGSEAGKGSISECTCKSYCVYLDSKELLTFVHSFKLKVSFIKSI